MDAFFCITLSILVIRAWWKHRPIPIQRKPVKLPPTRIQVVDETIDQELKVKREAEIQREKDINELRKQGYTDEVITTILPVINDN